MEHICATIPAQSACRSADGSPKAMHKPSMKVYVPDQTKYAVNPYSYHEAHLAEWQIPRDLAKQLPVELAAAVREWRYAGAAVCTALDRIAELESERLDRGYPESGVMAARHPTPPSSQPDLMSPSFTSTGSIASPISPPPSMFSSFSGSDHVRVDTPTQHARAAVTSMESPPFNSWEYATPEFSAEKYQDVDLHHLTKELAALTIPSAPPSHGFCAANTFSSTSLPPSWNERSWEFYLGTYAAELRDIRMLSGPRFRGDAHEVEKLRREVRAETARDTISRFDTWWVNMKKRSKQIDEQIDDLKLPIADFVRAERKAKGLHV